MIPASRCCADEYLRLPDIFIDDEVASGFFEIEPLVVVGPSGGNTLFFSCRCRIYTRTLRNVRFFLMRRLEIFLRLKSAASYSALCSVNRLSSESNGPGLLRCVLARSPTITNLIYHQSGNPIRCAGEPAGLLSFELQHHRRREHA